VFASSDFSVLITVSALRSVASVNKRILKYSTLVFNATAVEVTAVGIFTVVRCRGRELYETEHTWNFIG
jgi:hypothetical protein